jgi:hypothetical protein
MLRFLASKVSDTTQVTLLITIGPSGKLGFLALNIALLHPPNKVFPVAIGGVRFLADLRYMKRGESI